MMKCRVACLVATVAAEICLATAQSSKTHSSSAKPDSDRMQAATKPITPKSAMPAKRKSSIAPSASQGSGNANAELTRLERQPIKAGNGKNTPASNAPRANAKSASAPRVAKQ